MESIKFGYNMYRIQLRMIFGPKHRFRKEYDEALDAINLSGHWLYLYDSLEGPKRIKRHRSLMACRTWKTRRTGTGRKRW